VSGAENVAEQAENRHERSGERAKSAADIRSTIKELNVKRSNSILIRFHENSEVAHLFDYPV